MSKLSFQEFNTYRTLFAVFDSKEEIILVEKWFLEVRGGLSNVIFCI
jgi:hypothetical protein